MALPVRIREEAWGAEGERTRLPGQLLFKHIDSDRDGRIQFSEFEPLCQNIGWDSEQAHAFWSKADHDKSDGLGLVEFVAFASSKEVSPHIREMEAKECGPEQARAVTGREEGAAPATVTRMAQAKGLRKRVVDHKDSLFWSYVTRAHADRRRHAHTHIHIHTHTHTHTHAFTHTHTHRHTHIYTHAHTSTHF
jgi:hypothetical protein